MRLRFQHRHTVVYPSYSGFHRAPRHRPPPRPHAPNFGKTFGPFVTTGQSWTFKATNSLSEIGRQGVANSLELTSMIPAGTWRDHFVHQRMALATKTSVRAFFSTKCPTLVWQPKGAKGLSELSASQLKKIGEFMQDKNLLLLMSGSHL